MKITKSAIGIILAVMVFFGIRIYDKISTERTAREAIQSVLHQLPDYEKKKAEVEPLFEAAHANAFQRHYKWSWDRRTQNSFDEVSYVRDVFGMIEHGASVKGDASLVDDLITLQVAASVLMDDDNPLKRVFAEKISRLPKPKPEVNVPAQVDYDRLRAELAGRQAVLPSADVSQKLTIAASVAASDRKHLRHGSAADLYFLSDGRSSALIGGCYRAIENFVPEEIDWSGFEASEKAVLSLQLDSEQPPQKQLRKVLEAIKNEPVFCLRRTDSFSTSAHYGAARTGLAAACDCEKELPATSDFSKTRARTDLNTKPMKELRNDQSERGKWRSSGSR